MDEDTLDPQESKGLGEKLRQGVGGTGPGDSATPGGAVAGEVGVGDEVGGSGDLGGGGSLGSAEDRDADAEPTGP